MKEIVKKVESYRTKLLLAIIGMVVGCLITKGYISPEQKQPLIELLVGGVIFLSSVFGYHKYQGQVDVEKEKTKQKELEGK